MSGEIAPKKIRRGYERNLDAGPFQRMVSSLDLHLRAEKKSPKTIRAYLEAVQWFTAEYPIPTGLNDWPDVKAHATAEIHASMLLTHHFVAVTAADSELGRAVPPRRGDSPLPLPRRAHGPRGQRYLPPPAHHGRSPSRTRRAPKTPRSALRPPGRGCRTPLAPPPRQRPRITMAAQMCARCRPAAPERVAITGGIAGQRREPGESGRMPSMSRATVLPKDPRVRRRRPRRTSDQAQSRADSERAIVKYQQPPARFSAPRTRKKAAHP
jgi:hypothetical protein